MSCCAYLEFRVGNFSTPGVGGGTTFSVPASFLGGDEAGGGNQSSSRRQLAAGAAAPLDVQATQWGGNIYGFSESSAGMAGAVTSICIGGCGTTTNISEGFVFSMPTAFLAVGGGNCTTDEDCGGCPANGTAAFAYRKDCLPTGYCANSSCSCVTPYTGEHCAVEAVCKFWDEETEAYTTGTGDAPDCVVAAVGADSTTCNCSHLTDFASFQQEWVPKMNFINPFDPELFSAILADPRNLIVMLVIVAMYSLWIGGCIEGYRRDNADRHQYYMHFMAKEFGKTPLAGDIPLAAPINRIVLPEDLAKEKKAKTLGKKKQRLSKALRRMEKLNKRRKTAKKDGDTVHLEGLDVDIALQKKRLKYLRPHPVVRFFLKVQEGIRKFAIKFKLAIIEAHPWLSCVFVNPDDRFTRPQRITVLACILFGTIALEGFFFDDGFPRCLPADNGYPDCGDWTTNFGTCAGLADGGDDGRRRALQAASNSSNNTAPAALGVFSCPDSIGGPGSPDNNYAIGSVPACDACIEQLGGGGDDDDGEDDDDGDDDDGEEEVEWRKIIVTAILCSVIMLPADRIFVTMFEKVTKRPISRGCICHSILI